MRARGEAGPGQDPVQRSKRNSAAAWAQRVGITALIESVPCSNSVLVLTYHRVGDSWNTPYSNQVFSASVDDFAAQVAILKKRTTVVGLDEALQLLLSDKPFRGPVTLLTFDDGYLDNYQIAYPILRSQSVPACFFLVSSYVGTNYLPWWDRISYWVHRARTSLLRLSYPQVTELSLAADREGVIRVLAHLYRRAADPEKFLVQLQEACQAEACPDPGRIFLNWEEAREMAAGGMDIGAHTHTHCDLGRASLAAQTQELETCRRLLEEGLARRVDVLAYPYGTPEAFNEDTFRALDLTGYRAAFSFYGGIDRAGRANPHNLLRVPVDHSCSVPRFRFKVALAPRLNGYWF